MYNMITASVPKFLTVIQEDSEVQVAIATLDIINEMLGKIGHPITQCTGMPEKILTTVRDVLQQKVKTTRTAGMQLHLEHT